MVRAPPSVDFKNLQEEEMCACVAPETKDHGNSFMCLSFSSSTLEWIRKEVYVRTCASTNLLGNMGCVYRIPCPKTQEQSRNYSRSPQWAVLSAWVVYKSLVFARLFLSSLSHTPLVLFTKTTKYATTWCCPASFFSKSPPNNTMCVFVHKTCYPTSHGRCFVGIWSIKTASLPGLVVLTIPHTSGIFPKHCGV